MMLILATTITINPKFTYAQKAFSRDDRTIPLQIALFLLLIVAGLCVGWLLMQWQRRRGEPAKHHPTHLFHHLQKLLGLSMTDRWRLSRLAKAIDIEHPTALMISETLYDHAVQTYASRHKSPDPGYAAIRAKLFPPLV